MGRYLGKMLPWALGTLWNAPWAPGGPQGAQGGPRGPRGAQGSPAPLNPLFPYRAVGALFGPVDKIDVAIWTCFELFW